MAIVVYTDKPRTLLKSIKNEIAQGNIKTWGFDQDGDFTHVADQWNEQAWLTPSVQAGMLIFGLIGKKNKEMSKAVYAVYHGRFIEMLLAHFDDKFISVGASALGEEIDSY